MLSRRKLQLCGRAAAAAQKVDIAPTQYLIKQQIQRTGCGAGQLQTDKSAFVFAEIQQHITVRRNGGTLPEGAHPPAVRAIVSVRSLYAGVEEARVGGARLLPIAKVLRLR